MEGETEAQHRSTWAARHCCQRNQQQPAGPNCPKNPSGLLSVAVFKPGDCQHPGSRMVLMQDPAQGAGGGTGTWKTHQDPTSPPSIRAALSQCPGPTPLFLTPRINGWSRNVTAPPATEPGPLWGSSQSQRNPSWQNPCPAWLGDGDTARALVSQHHLPLVSPAVDGKGQRKQVLRVPWLG